jgi:hypothetical protein
MAENNLRSKPRHSLHANRDIMAQSSWARPPHGTVDAHTDAEEQTVVRGSERSLTPLLARLADLANADSNFIRTKPVYDPIITQWLPNRDWVTIG